MNSYTITFTVSGIQSFTVRAESEGAAVEEAKRAFRREPPDSFGLDIDPVAIDLEEEDI